MSLRTSILGGLACLASVCAMAAGGAAPAPPASGTGLADVVRAARADAARRTGLAAEALELVSAESVTWSDGSLGCPQPDVLYTQALVPGYRIVLRGPVGEMDYHASARGALVLCPVGRRLAPLPRACEAASGRPGHPPAMKYAPGIVLRGVALPPARRAPVCAQAGAGDVRRHRPPPG